MAMTERHEDPRPAGRRLTTGEFRAVPDISANTAQFQRFAEDSHEPARAWEMGAPRRSPARLTAIIVTAIVILAIIAVLVAKLA
jgi:hypothetical protein